MSQTFIYREQFTLFIFIALITICGCSNHTGNIDEKTMKNVIYAAEEKYTQMSDIKIFVADSLDKIWAYSWNVHMYGPQIKDSFSYCHYHYGKYNYTYMIWKDNACKIKSSMEFQRSVQEDYGSSMTYALKQKLHQAIEEASTYQGNDMLKHSQYISNKMSSGSRAGNWTVLITTPSGVRHSGYQCRVGEYWASLRDYGIFHWDYYVVRSN